MENDIAKSLALLTGLRDNLPEGRHGEVKKVFVDQYTEAIKILERSTSADLSEFKIDYGLLKPQVTSISMSGKNYTEDAYLSRDYLKMKIEAVLAYYTLSLQPEEIKNRLGFRIDE